VNIMFLGLNFKSKYSQVVATLKCSTDNRAKHLLISLNVA